MGYALLGMDMGPGFELEETIYFENPLNSKENLVDKRLQISWTRPVVEMNVRSVIQSSARILLAMLPQQCLEKWLFVNCDAIEFFHNSRLILDEFNKIKFSKKLT